MYDERVAEIINTLTVTDSQRLSNNECMAQDNRDTAIVKAKLDHYAQRLIPIAHQLEAYASKSFLLTSGQNGVRALAKEPGIIELDYATLNKSNEELAFTLAHEWGHHALGHLRNKHVKKRMKITDEEAEHSADFYAGLFLGYHDYDLKKLLEPKLHMPDGNSCHGTRIERAQIIARGFVLGQEMQQGNVALGFVPAYEAYVKNTGHSPWHVEGKSAYSEAELSKLRNESK